MFNIRQTKITGTKPKTRKDTVMNIPQEIVAPTRRELYNEIVNWTSHPQHPHPPSHQTINYQKPQNNCFELDNLTLHDNSRFIPVRPIVRRNHLHEDMNEQNTINQSSANISNTAIGIVTPNLTTQPPLNDQHINTNDSYSYTIPTRIREPLQQTLPSGLATTITGTTVQQPNNRQQQLQQQQHANITLPPRSNVEEKLNHIQEYIKITTSLLNSMQVDEITKGEHTKLTKSLEGLKDSETKLINILKKHYLTDIDMKPEVEQEKIIESTEMINSLTLRNVSENDSINDNEESARPQSVSSIHTITTPNTPTYDDLQAQVEIANRNMTYLKDQQNELRCLQELSKQQILELERTRPKYFDNIVPNYETVGQVEDDVSSLTARLKVVSNLIKNQNELSTLIGGDGENIKTEHATLQKQFSDLKSKRQQMNNLLAEYTNLNDQRDQRFDDQLNNTSTTRIIPIDYQRVVPIEMTNTTHKQFIDTAESENDENDHLDDNLDNNVSAQNQLQQTTNIMDDKIAEINAMKEQLKRLKDMMDTVKLIEIKNGDAEIEDEHDDAGDYDLQHSVQEHHHHQQQQQQTNNNNSYFNQPEQDNNYSNTSNTTASSATTIKPLILDNTTHKVLNRNNSVNDCDFDETTDQREAMNQRFTELTQDLKQQAMSLAAHRDRFKFVKDDLKVRDIQLRESSETILKAAKLLAAQRKRSVSPREREQIALRAELEAKKREYEKILKKIENETEASKDIKRQEGEYMFYPENWSESHLINSNSSLHSSDHRNHDHIKNTSSISTTRNKSPTNSGTGDLFNDTGCTQSESLRSLSMPPPMPHLPDRNSNWRKSSHDNTTNQSQPLNCCLPPPHSRNHFSSPWHHFNTTTSNCQTECQSPHILNNWHQNTEHNISNNNNNNYLPFSSANSNDSSLIEDFLQTQQLLINIITACNDLLANQQTDIFALKNCIICLQDHVLLINRNLYGNNLQNQRAESVPISAPPVQFPISQYSLPPQPFLLNLPPSLSTSRPIHINSASNNNNNNMQRNTGNTNCSSCSMCSLRDSNINNYQHNTMDISQQNQATTLAAQTQQLRSLNLRSQSVNADTFVQPFVQATTHSHLSNLSQTHPQRQTTPQSQTPILLQQQQQQHNNDSIEHNQPINIINPLPQQIYMHHNNTNLLNNNTNNNTNNNNNNVNNNLNNSNNNNNNLNNINNNIAQNKIQMQQAMPPTIQPGQHSSTASLQQQTNASNNLTNSAYNSSSGTPTLNNQVPPGNRANNYWDNFRSYSRQNLLSGNTCKSNDGGGMTTSNNVTHNTNQQMRNQQPSTMTYNNQFRNQFNQLNISSTSTTQQDLINTNQIQQQQQQQHQQQQTDSINENLILNNNNLTNIQMSNHIINSDLNNMNTTGLLQQFQSNPINLGVHHELYTKSKTLPKGKKKQRLHSVRQFDPNTCKLSNPHTASSGSDLNLVSATQQNTKSTTKIFESLKENVYLEVSALISANESRPQFLIQLFRELRLISSDPLRQRALQSIQDLYNRYVETVNEEDQTMQQIPQQTVSMSNLTSENEPNQNFNILLTQNNTCLEPNDFLSTNFDILHMIIQEISSIIQNNDIINDNILEKIYACVLTHINTSNCDQTNFSSIEFKKYLYQLNRINKEIFLKNFHNYLNCVFIKDENNQKYLLNSRITTTTTLINDEEKFNDCPFNIDYQTVSSASSSLSSTSTTSTTFTKIPATDINSIINQDDIIMTNNNNNINNNVKRNETEKENQEILNKKLVTNNNNIFGIGLIPSNEDLAEADQICNNENLYMKQDNNNICDDDEDGAKCSLLTEEEEMPELNRLTEMIEVDCATDTTEPMILEQKVEESTDMNVDVINIIQINENKIT